MANKTFKLHQVVINTTTIKGIMDANIILLDNGSAQKHIWGFNVHLEKDKDDWIEYTSLINIRPTDNNFDMEVKDKDIRDKMKKIINSKII